MAPVPKIEGHFSKVKVRGTIGCHGMTVMRGSLPLQLLHKGSGQADDFARLFIQCEVSRIEDMHFGRGHVTCDRLRRRPQ